MTRLILPCFTCLLSLSAFAQQPADTTQLPEVQVMAYPGRKYSFLQVPSSSAVITEKQILLQQGTTLIPTLNTVPGIRMEERSPGSYRLSLRGSLLRSPFGIRNVKIYMDEIPFTDAGGNTYLNVSDAGAFSGIEVLKGPDGSQFGANSGGVVLLHPAGTLPDTAHLKADTQGGSYGLFHEEAGWQQEWKKYKVNIYEGVQRSDGYRQNSALKRYYIQTAQQWQYNPNNNLKLIAFYSDMDYRTPGGLTAAQAAADPRAARPATPTLPGALEQHAGIRNKTALGGLVHTARLSTHWKHVFTLYGINTHFENPFITNFEARDENTAGARTYIALQDQPINGTNIHVDWTTGIEWSQTNSDIVNYGNNKGKRDTVQAASNITAGQHFFFTSLSVRPGTQWIIEAALSANYFKYRFEEGRKKFDAQLMPRVSLSYLILPEWSVRASVSRGYSPPSIAEVRATDNIINTTLQAETGWNYEAGFRLQGARHQYQLDAAVFYYKLQDAIVRQLHDDGTEYFINAGGTEQKGIEVQGMTWFTKWLQFNASYAYSHFIFSDYNAAGKNLSGNAITGVPRHVAYAGLLAQLPARLSVYAQYTFTDKLPLDDANTAYAKQYHLLQGKVSWQMMRHVTLYAGADNILNQFYSLGNDLNAVGNRYFNPAPLRNYYGGIRVQL